MKSVLHLTNSQRKEASVRPLMVCIPGGSCFSSQAWGDTAPLLEEYDVALLDLPGLGEAPAPLSYDYEAVLSSVESELKKLNRSVVLLGHSFGAIYAASIATRTNSLKVEGFVGVAGPVSAQAYTLIGPHADSHLTQEVRDAEAAFFSNPSEEGWKRCLSLWGPSYFSEARREEGVRMLLNDKSGYEMMMAIAAPVMGGQVQLNLETSLKEFPGKKLFIGGRNDCVVPLEAMKLDASTTGSELLVFDAPHRIPLEAAGELADAISERF